MNSEQFLGDQVQAALTTVQRTNLDKVQAAYDEALTQARFEAAERSSALGRILLFGSLALLVLLGMQALLRLSTKAYVWLPAAAVAAASLFVGLAWLNPESDWGRRFTLAGRLNEGQEIARNIEQSGPSESPPKAGAGDEPASSDAEDFQLSEDADRKSLTFERNLKRDGGAETNSGGNAATSAAEGSYGEAAPTEVVDEAATPAEKKMADTMAAAGAPAPMPEAARGLPPAASGPLPPTRPEAAMPIPAPGEPAPQALPSAPPPRGDVASDAPRPQSAARSDRKDSLPNGGRRPARSGDESDREDGDPWAFRGKQGAQMPADSRARFAQDPAGAKTLKREDRDFDNFRRSGGPHQLRIEADKGAADFASLAPASLYFDPALATDEQGRATIEFDLPPVESDYRVLIDAIGNGRIGSRQIVVTSGASE